MRSTGFPLRFPCFAPCRPVAGPIGRHILARSSQAAVFRHGDLRATSGHFPFTAEKRSTTDARETPVSAAFQRQERAFLCMDAREKRCSRCRDPKPPQRRNAPNRSIRLGALLLGAQRHCHDRIGGLSTTATLTQLPEGFERLDFRHSVDAIIPPLQRSNARRPVWTTPEARPPLPAVLLFRPSALSARRLERVCSLGREA